MEIYLEDSNGDQICFNHAVKAVIKDDESISICNYDDRDCGQSGAWWIGGCKQCEKDNKIGFNIEDETGIEEC